MSPFFVGLKRVLGLSWASRWNPIGVLGRLEGFLVSQERRGSVLVRVKQLPASPGEKDEKGKQFGSETSASELDKSMT